LTLLVAVTVILAVPAVLAAIVIVAVGGGGELSREHPDHPPLALPGRRAIGGTDAALLRLPLGLWGYHKQITDEALERFAYELTERDTRIAVLEQELAEARQGRDGGGTRDRRPALPPARNDLPVMGGDPPATREEPLGTSEGSAVGAAGAAGHDDPVSGHAYTPPTDPWRTVPDHLDDVEVEAEAEADDIAERRPARKEDGE
jgi:hypothetical protein